MPWRLGCRLAEPLRQHREKTRRALLGFRAAGDQVGRRVAGNAARFELHGLHDGLERLAHLAGGGIPTRWIFFEAHGDDALQLDRYAGNDLVEIRRVGELDGADDLKILGVGAGERMASAGEFIEQHAQSPDIRLHAGLAGDELLWRHVADSAAARGVGLGHRCVTVHGRFGGVESSFLGVQPPGEAEVENLHQAAVGKHHILRLQVAVKDAQRVRGLETVGDLNADRQHKLNAGRAALDEKVQGLPRHKLHDDVGFFAGFAYLVDGADVRVLDCGSQARLAQDRGAHLGQGKQAAAQDLEHHGPGEQSVVGQIHYSAAACAQAAEYLVVLDHASFCRRPGVPGGA